MSLPFRDAIDGFICLCPFPRCCCFGTWLLTVHFFWVQYSSNQWHFEFKNPLPQDFITFLFYHVSSFTNLKLSLALRIIIPNLNTPLPRPPFIYVFSCDRRIIG
ncbi:Uncharacterized protein TCM_034054 [Theobroma cacao]|uniref:Uncharacterized protein n=1 Tax=Theobroma cacao TaxID=3641 RepID=A0A061FDL0_THECC|nr:Uncharacterized protein TCM_034054 [Theobroma cacao]